MIFLCLETWLFKGTFSTVFPVAHMVKNLPAVQKTGFDPWVRKIPWRRKWQSTLALLPGKSHGQRSLIGYSPWGRKESDTTERLHFTSLHRVGGVVVVKELEGEQRIVFIFTRIF